MSYKFSQLNKAGQKKAIEDYRQSMFDDGDIDDLLEPFFKEHLGASGFPSDDVKYNLTYSPDDHMIFTGTIDIPDYIKKNKLESQFSHYITDRDFSLYIGKMGDLDWKTGEMEEKLTLISSSTNNVGGSDPLFQYVEKHIARTIYALKEGAYTIIDEETGAKNIIRLLNEFDYQYNLDGTIFKEIK